MERVLRAEEALGNFLAAVGELATVDEVIRMCQDAKIAVQEKQNSTISKLKNVEYKA